MYIYVYVFVYIFSKVGVWCRQEFVDDVNKDDSRRVLVAKMGDGRGIDLPNVKLGFHGISCVLGWDYWGWKKHKYPRFFMGLIFRDFPWRGPPLGWGYIHAYPLMESTLKGCSISKMVPFSYLYIHMYTQMLHVFTYNYHKDWLIVGIPYMVGMGCMSFFI